MVDVQGTAGSELSAKMALPVDVREYPDAIAQGLRQLRLAGVNGPYAVLDHVKRAEAAVALSTSGKLERK